MKANYTRPDTKIIPVVCNNIIASSTVSSISGQKGTFLCSRYCRHWRFCLDRKLDKFCQDKEY